MGRNIDYLPEPFHRILRPFPIKPLKIEQYKLVFRVTAAEGIFALKEIKYPENEFRFIYAAMEHLVSHGFTRINKMMLTKNYYPFSEFKGRKFGLSKWIQGREADYSQKWDLNIAARTLADLHKSSKDFNPPPFEGRIKWGTWPVSMKGKMEELLDFKKSVQRKSRKSFFDQVFLAHVDYYVGECETALEYLARGAYEKVNSHDAQKQYFCHHDYAYHNVIIDEKGKGNVIDFDYCISDIRCHDIGSLMLRVLKKGEWNYKKAMYALKSYDHKRRVSSKETEVIKALLRFPQDFWQVAFAYYVERNQPRDRLERKIKNWVQDKERRRKSLCKLDKLI